jgi:hypothetical protein
MPWLRRPPEHGVGQSEAAQQPPEQSPAQASWDGELPPAEIEPIDDGAGEPADDPATPTQGHGVVVVDFGGLGPEAA